MFGYFTVYINDVPSSQENLTLSAKHPTSISLMPQSLIGLFPFQKCPSFGDDTFSTNFFFFFFIYPIMIFLQDLSFPLKKVNAKMLSQRMIQNHPIFFSQNYACNMSSNFMVLALTFMKMFYIIHSLFYFYFFL